MSQRVIGNIFALAMSVIPQQSATLYRWQGRAVNERGLDVDAFGPPEALAGCSIQPVDRSRYGYFGLDAGKSYLTVYSAAKVGDLTRNENPDQIEYAGRRYRVMNRSEWHAPAGYNGMLIVDIGPAAGSEAKPSPLSENSN